jgi:uncharacterized phage protein (TIGR02218 family)
VKTIDPGLAEHIAGGVTTLCQCWRLTRRDGTVLAFTDHDRPVVFDGDTYEPASGFDASEAVSQTGFATGGADVYGALSSDRLLEDDLAAGLYDGAEMRVFLVNWSMPQERHLLRIGHLGEVVREDAAFRAEIRSLAALLDQPQGRVFRHGCDADLGDDRCKVNLNAAAFRGEGEVSAAAGRRQFDATGLDAFTEGWFERGRIEWTGGANAGRAGEVRAHLVSGDIARIELWQPVQHAIEAGDAFVVTAGCDKLFSTCRTKFDNADNFRGFPHMPGNDFALSYARGGDRNTGAALIE